MVSNSTNISTKQTTSSDVKSSNLKEDYDIWRCKSGHGLGHVHRCGWIKLVNRTPNCSSLNNCISNSNTCINKWKKTQPCTDSFSLKMNTYYYKKEWQHKHEQYNSSQWMLALCIHSYQHTIHTDVDNVMKTTTYDVRNPGHGLGYVHKCGGIKLVNRTPTFS